MGLPPWAAHPYSFITYGHDSPRRGPGIFIGVCMHVSTNMDLSLVCIPVSVGCRTVPRVGMVWQFFARFAQRVKLITRPAHTINKHCCLQVWVLYCWRTPPAIRLAGVKALRKHQERVRVLCRTVSCRHWIYAKLSLFRNMKFMLQLRNSHIHRE